MVAARRHTPAAAAAAARMRGYNLVEMAIALTVLGLILGGALLPLKARYESEQTREARALLERAKDAVFGYALQNRTSARVVAAAHGVEYDAPAGRPYLPCPDIDNDGEEDRHQPAAAGVTVTQTDDDATNELTGAGSGMCMEQKGMLPWKTLGLPGLDPWGTRLTYRVDPAFSHPVMGFDGNTRADTFDRAAALLTMNLEAEGFLIADRADRNQIGNIVCSEIINAASAGGCPNDNGTNVLAGVFHVADPAVTLTLGISRVRAHNAANPTGLIEGAVFVIVSHGKNALGGINTSGQCRGAPPQTTDLIEAANAFYRGGHPFITNFGCTSPSPSPVALYENMFGSAPVSNVSGADRARPDDLVVWSGGNELIGVMLRGGVFPLEPLEMLPQ